VYIFYFRFRYQHALQYLPTNKVQKLARRKKTWLTSNMLTSKGSLGKWTIHRVHKGNRVKGGGLAPPPSPARADFSIMMKCTPEIGHCHSMCTGTVLCGATYVPYVFQAVLISVQRISCEGSKTQKVKRQLYLFQPWQPPYSSSPWICPWWLAHRSCPAAPPSLPPLPATQCFFSTLTDQIIIKGFVAICHSFYIFSYNTYITEQGGITSQTQFTVGWDFGRQTFMSGISAFLKLKHHKVVGRLIL